MAGVIARLPGAAERKNLNSSETAARNDLKTAARHAVLVDPLDVVYAPVQVDDADRKHANVLQYFTFLT